MVFSLYKVFLRTEHSYPDQQTAVNFLWNPQFRATDLTADR